MTSQKTKILIIEDHDIFRMGLCELINNEEDLIVCGEAAEVDEAWEKVRDLKPDMAIIDISLKNGNGIDLIERIKNYDKTILVLVLSMHDESLYAERSLLAGAKGYIMKQETSDSVILAVRQVLDGKIYVSEKYKETILDTFASRSSGVNRFPLERLTNRELEVFNFIGQGLTTKDIAQKLNLGAKTIGTYRERIKDKLNIKNANELIKQAVYWVSNQKV
ncbi:response regulator transcription factor [bacterium]|nr:response regulator transcription factor [bacterium]